MNDHALQAPFIYDFYNKVLKGQRISEDYLAIESLRKELLISKLQIEVESYGAKSKVDNRSLRSVSKIARNGITDVKTSQLLQRIIRMYDLNNIIELGTSLGLNTMYMGLDQRKTITTFEGCGNTLDLARNNFEKLAFANINPIEGNIDKTLREYLSESIEPIEFAYIDANHRLKPTLTYFDLLYSKVNNKSVFVFDDIHWSPEMTQAWKTIVNDPRVTLSIDTYDLGIVFFKPELSKQHYILRY